MGVPVVGACLAAVLLATNLRAQFRLPRAPGPSGSISLSENGCGSESESDTPSIDSNSDFPEHLANQWPTITHAGSGFSVAELQRLYESKPGTVLWK